MNLIFNFCENAEKIFVSSTEVKDLKKLQIKINPLKDEVWCSRYTKSLGCLFDFSLKINPTTTIDDEIQYMQTIELFYPNTFDWRFNGEHVEAIAYIPMTKDNLGMFTRYGSVFNFIKYLRKQLSNILRYRGYEGLGIYKYIDHKIIATGSINTETQLYVVNISPSYSKTDILTLSNNRITSGFYPVTLDMRFWIREMNPDFFKLVPRLEKKMHPVSKEIVSKYPPCIKKLYAMPEKGNYNRFLLATFLLGVHKERDAKHQLDVMLTDAERTHMNYGDCKDQWRTIVVKKYTPPSCKTMIECGFCEDNCGRAAPVILDIEDKK